MFCRRKHSSSSVSGFKKKRGNGVLFFPLFFLFCAVLFPSPSPAGATAAALKDKWIALVVEYSASDYMRQYIEGAREQADELGLRLEILDARYVKQAMSGMIDDVTLRNVDGILLSHGAPELLRSSLKRSVRRGIPVVAVHCELDLPGVTLLGQDDRQIARMVMQKIIGDTGGEADLALIWMPGFEPFRKRMEVYSRMMAVQPGLKEIARFGTAGDETALRTELSMQQLLKSHPQGTIDVVFATWDEYAKGAAGAIMDAGRDEIRLYGIDLSDAMLKMLQDPANPLVATVGVDSRQFGKVQVRMMAHALLGHHLPAEYMLKPVLVSKAMLPLDRSVTMPELIHYVEGWEALSVFPVQTDKH